MKGYASDTGSEAPKEPTKKSKKSKKKNQEMTSKKKSKSGSSKKVERDPDAPKKPLPAFLLFSNNKRREMKENNVGNQWLFHKIVRFGANRKIKADRIRVGQDGKG